MAEQTKDWIKINWQQLTALVIVVIAFAGVKMEAQTNTSAREKHDADFKKLDAVIFKSAENEKKNHLTFMNLESFKKSQGEKLDTMLRSQTESMRIQTRMLTIVESFGNIYPTKENMQNQISDMKDYLQVRIDKKVGYDRVDLRTLKN